MIHKKKYYLLVIISSFINEFDSAKILAFFPTPSISHQMTFYPLTNELLRKGHEVTVVTTDPLFPKEKSPKNLTEINIHDVSYRLWAQLLTEATHRDYNFITQVYILGNMYTKLFENQILVPEVKNILKMEKHYFDLILVEACYTPGLVLSHIYNAPLVQISSFGALMHNLEAIGAPTHPYLYPTALRKRIHNLTLWEKVKEFHAVMCSIIIRIMNEHYLNAVIKEHFGPDVPSIDELRENVNMLLLNVNPMWAGNMPVPPGVIYTGGIHLKPQNDLPQELKTYLDSSKNGVIYVSFGTNVKTNKFTQRERQKFLNVLNNLPYDVLWKWDEEELPGRAQNIKISKWLPQADLLAHPNIKLFITQGGLQSTDEAIIAGVPLIGVPMLGDQWYNVEKYLKFKIGLRVYIESFTENELRDAINIVIEDDSYRNNVEKLRNQMYDQPQMGLDRGIWWIEYLLRHRGARHLRAPATNMSWSEYYELKLILIVFCALLIAVLILVSIVKYLRKLIAKLLTKIMFKID